jgi:hypothetical protein
LPRKPKDKERILNIQYGDIEEEKVKETIQEFVITSANNGVTAQTVMNDIEQRLEEDRSTLTTAFMNIAREKEFGNEYRASQAIDDMAVGMTNGKDIEEAANDAQTSLDTPPGDMLTEPIDLNVDQGGETIQPLEDGNENEAGAGNEEQTGGGDESGGDESGGDESGGIVKIIPISDSTEFEIVLILKDTKSSHVTNP